MSTTDPAQFELVYASMVFLSIFLNISPLPGVDFKYLKILLTAFMCSSLGICINWLTTLTTKEITGRV